MARPRVLMIEEGEVQLVNFPKEKADVLEQYLYKFGKETTTSPVVTPPAGFTFPASNPNNMTLDEVAFGIRHNKNSGRWELITVRYHADSRSSMVEAVSDAGENKAIAVNHLKLTMFKNGIV